MEQDFTMGDETTRCGPHQDDQAIPVCKAQSVMRRVMERLDDSGGEAGPDFLNFLYNELVGSAGPMRHIRARDDTTPATQIDQSQASQTDAPMAEPVPGPA